MKIETNISLLNKIHPQTPIWRTKSVIKSFKTFAEIELLTEETKLTLR